jgi:hypothetical protein
MMNKDIIEIFLFIFYLILFVFILKRIDTEKNTLYKPKVFVSLFVLKSIFGLFYIFITYNKYLRGSDSIGFLKEASNIVPYFKSNIWIYLRMVFGANDIQPEPVYLLPCIEKLGFWYDNSNFFVVRVLSILYLFTFGNPYIITLFFAFATTISLIYLISFIHKRMNVNEVALLSLLFLFSGFNLWTSIIHKEALILILIVGLIYIIQKISFKFSFSLFLLIFPLLLMLGMLRYYTLALLFPSIIAYLITTKNSKVNVLFTFSYIHFIFLVFAIYIDINFDGISLLNEISIRQGSYYNHPGNTSFDTIYIDNSIYNLLKMFPNVLINTFIHPFFSGCKNIFCTLSSIETGLICITILILLSMSKVKSIFRSPENCLLLFFSFSITSLTGIIVNNGGAIARYRVIAIFFIIVALLNSLESHKKLSR